MADTVHSPLITINASEVASVMGRHQHQPRNETMLKVWQRADTRTFCLANSLEYRSEVAAIINYERSNGDTTCCESLASLLTENWDLEEDSFIKVLQEIVSDKKFLGLRGKIAKQLKCLTIRNYRDEKLLKDANIHQEVNHEANILAIDEKKPVTESAREFCEKRGIKNEEVIKAVDSSLTKMRGTKLESKTIQVFGEKKGIEFSMVEELLKGKVMESDGFRWLLQGRADALMENTVIEVKNRIYKFMQPKYDLIQLQVYLFLYDMDNGILLERLKKEEKETSVKFEVESWIEEVIPALKAFVEEVHNLIKKNREHFSKDSLDSTTRSPLKRTNEETNDTSIIPEKTANITKITSDIPQL